MDSAGQAAKLVGTTLRRKWRIDALIGVGGMANVYRATHRNGREVAVKILHGQFVNNAEVCERFLREGYVANKINHPGVVGILDDDTLDDGSAFLVMELLEGESLQDRLERSRMGAVEALFVADQLLDVLAAAHAKGVIHRDIKPGNVFLLKDGRLKVLDFGLARVLEGHEQFMTRDGLVLGTLAYMPPEQARAKRDQIDARSDLFSVGATLFYALSGHLVRDEPNQMDRLMAAMRQPVRSLGTAMLEFPPGVVALVDKALAFAPEDRWQTAREMQQAVRHVFHSLTGNEIPATHRVNLKGMVGWTRPVSSSRQLPAESGSTVASLLEVTVVFEPADQPGLSIPIDVSSEDGSMVIPIDVEPSTSLEAADEAIQVLTDDDFES